MTPQEAATAYIEAKAAVEAALNRQQEAIRHLSTITRYQRDSPLAISAPLGVVIVKKLGYDNIDVEVIKAL